MNQQKIASKQTWLIAVAVMTTVLASRVVTGNSGQILQKTFAENNSTTNARDSQFIFSNK